MDDYNKFIRCAPIDGKTDDINSIAAAHAFANLHGLPVKADENASYYIGGKERTAEIRTSTDFGSANFIIDDTEVENSTVGGRNFINLRSDYGSNWQGEFIIRNCRFIPRGGQETSADLFGGFNSGQHDFGYTCYMPEKITIENLYIDDSNHPDDYQGAAIFADFNPEKTNDSYQENFPYIITDRVILKGIKTSSGKSLRLSDNLYMFRDVLIEKD